MNAGTCELTFTFKMNLECFSSGTGRRERPCNKSADSIFRFCILLQNGHYWEVQMLKNNPDLPTCWITLLDCWTLSTWHRHGSIVTLTTFSITTSQTLSSITPYTCLVEPFSLSWQEHLIRNEEFVGSYPTGVSFTLWPLLYRKIPRFGTKYAFAKVATRGKPLLFVQYCYPCICLIEKAWQIASNKSVPKCNHIREMPRVGTK